MSRGNGGEEIYANSADRIRFLTILSDLKARTRFELFAYCLMSNHFHLLVRVWEFDISIIMQQLLTRYATDFNFTHERRGHLFQSRFKAIHCDRNPYFFELVRYIHLNPVRAGLVATADEWEWSGHHEYVGRKTRHHLLDLEPSLSMFSDKRELAVARYLEFLGQVDAEADKRISASLRSNSSGSSNEAVRSAFERPDLLELARDAAASSGLSLETIASPTRCRKVTRARKDFVLRSTAEGYRPSEIAAFIHRSKSAVSKIVNSQEQVNKSTSDT